MEPKARWAVCPRPDDIHGTDEPKFFESESKANRFLNRQILRPGLRDLGVQERRRLIREWKQAREDALRKWKAEGSSPLAFPEQFRIIRNKDQGWGSPVSVVGIVSGLKCRRSFREFLPPGEISPVAPEDLSALIKRVFSGNMPDYTCLLEEEWRFGEIEKDAMKRVGHEFEGRKHGSVAEIVLKSLYDLEQSLFLFHQNASCDAVAKFWTSWNVQRHLAEFTERIKESSTVRSLSHEPRRAARAAREHLNVQLAVFAHEIASVPNLITRPTPVFSGAATASRDDVQPSSSVEVRRLKAFRDGLDGQDAILRAAMEDASNYQVPIQMWKAVKLVFDALPADLAGLANDFAFDPQPNVLRSQISALRVKLENRITAALGYSEGGEAATNVQETEQLVIEPTWVQLERLRQAAHIDIEDLAERIDVAPRSVYRHLSGSAVPQPKQFAAYERVFSELLDRKVVITKMSGKRH
jgi:hypothetical protein